MNIKSDGLIGEAVKRREPVPEPKKPEIHIPTPSRGTAGPEAISL